MTPFRVLFLGPAFPPWLSEVLFFFFIRCMCLRHRHLSGISLAFPPGCFNFLPLNDSYSSVDCFHRPRNKSLLLRRIVSSNLCDRVHLKHGSRVFSGRHFQNGAARGAKVDDVCKSLKAEPKHRRRGLVQEAPCVFGYLISLRVPLHCQLRAEDSQPNVVHRSPISTRFEHKSQLVVHNHVVQMLCPSLVGPRF